MRYTELQLHLTACIEGTCEFAPMYVISGDDDYLKSMAIAAFKGITDEAYRDFNYTAFAGAEHISDAIEALNTFPVFDERRVVVVRDIAEKLSDSDRAAAENYAKAPSAQSVFVLQAEEGVTLGCEKAAETVDCRRLTGAELDAEITKLLSASPSKGMDGAARAELIRRTQSSMARISSEIAKLKCYCGGDITADAVSEMVAPDTDFQIYELSSAVSAKEADKTLEVLDFFARSGVRGVTVLNLLYNHYRRMLHAELNKSMDNAELAKLLDMKPAAVFHLRKVSKEYSQVRLKKCVDYLNDMQYAVLSGRRLENSALNEAVLTLLNM